MMQRVLNFGSPAWLKALMQQQPDLESAVTRFRAVATDNKLGVLSGPEADYVKISFLAELDQSQSLQALLVEARWLIENDSAVCVYLAMPTKTPAAQQRARTKDLLLQLLLQEQVFARQGLARIGLRLPMRPNNALSLMLQSAGFQVPPRGFVHGPIAADATEVWWADLAKQTGLTWR